METDYRAPDLPDVVARILDFDELVRCRQLSEPLPFGEFRQRVAVSLPRSTASDPNDHAHGHEACQAADELLVQPPDIGYLTISNALQWRLQYSRVIDKAGSVSGVQRLM